MIFNLLSFNIKLGTQILRIQNEIVLIFFLSFLRNKQNTPNQSVFLELDFFLYFKIRKSSFKYAEALPNLNSTSLCWGLDWEWQCFACGHQGLCWSHAPHFLFLSVAEKIWIGRQETQIILSYQIVSRIHLKMGVFDDKYSRIKEGKDGCKQDIINITKLEEAKEKNFIWNQETVFDNNFQTSF